MIKNGAQSDLLRWYDYIVALLFADLMLNALAIPLFGFIFAYALYEFAWNAYCQYRLQQEYEQ